MHRPGTEKHYIRPHLNLLKNKFLCLRSTVRIWDYTQDACINVLSGHKAPVRGLLWNTEVPYLLISGKVTVIYALTPFIPTYYSINVHTVDLLVSLNAMCNIYKQSNILE